SQCGWIPSTEAQTYGISDFEGRNQTVFRGVSDTSVTAHEIGEWLDDPGGNNPITPPWGNIGQTRGCQGNLEVGNPHASGSNAQRLYLQSPGVGLLFLVHAGQSFSRGWRIVFQQWNVPGFCSALSARWHLLISDWLKGRLPYLLTAELTSRRRLPRVPRR